MSLVIPALFIIIFTVAAAKKVNVFSSFCAGAGDGLKFTLSVLPVIAAVFMMCAIAQASGIADAATAALAPAMRALGIPEELAKLAIIKPFSGSGSLSLLTGTVKEYGADSYISRCACTLYASSETVFYVYALYFAGGNKKGRALPLAAVAFSSALAAVLACLLCKIM